MTPFRLTRRCAVFVTGALMTMVVSAGAMQKIDGIVAFVGDSAILQSELEAYMLMKTGGTPDSTADSLAKTMLRGRSLEELIEGKVLLVHAAKDTNISLSENEIDAELTNRIQMILRQNNLSMTDFETVLEKQQGISLAKFKIEVRKQIRQDLLKQKVQQQYVSAATADRTFVEQFYRDYKDSLPPAGKSVLLALIQVDVSPTEKIRQDAYAKIKAIKDRLDNGEDFDKAAQLFSDGPNAAMGGDLGFVAKGSLNEIVFEEKAFSMSPGDISDIFSTRLGFHIITVVAKKEQKVHVKQIFMPVSPPEEQILSVRHSLDSIRNTARDSTAFLAAVRHFSCDNASKSRNGLIGWREVASLDPQVIQAIDSLKPGDITGVIQNGNTFSLYRIEQIADSRQLTIDEDWAEISGLAQRIYAQKKLIDLVKKWRQETFIDIRL